MVAAIVLLTILANKLRIAYPILLVVAGLLISFVPGLPMVRVDLTSSFSFFYHLYCSKQLGAFLSKK
jgi:CPA1 family monovalent cation:H+ antiporter